MNSRNCRRGNLRSQVGGEYEAHQDCSHSGALHLNSQAKQRIFLIVLRRPDVLVLSVSTLPFLNRLLVFAVSPGNDLLGFASVHVFGP